jgi:hypothetical protein
MKKIFVALLICAMLGIGVTGCGNRTQKATEEVAVENVDSTVVDAVNAVDVVDATLVVE